MANIPVLPFDSLACKHPGFLGRFVVNHLMTSFRIEPHLLTVASLFLSENQLNDLEFISQSQWTDYNHKLQEAFENCLGSSDPEFPRFGFQGLRGYLHFYEEEDSLTFSHHNQELIRSTICSSCFDTRQIALKSLCNFPVLGDKLFDVVALFSTEFRQCLFSHFHRHSVDG
jgi:hypothetical protein